MTEQKVIDKAKAWADKEYDELRYSKCEKKRFVFTFHELREMGKQAFIAGHEAGADELRKELEDAKKTQVVEHFEAYGQCRDSRRIAALDAKLEKARALLAQWAQTSLAGACDNVNLAAETEQFLAGEI